MFLLFYHTEERVKIMQEHAVFECSPDRFAELEPLYPGIPEGGGSRYWTNDQAFFTGNIVYDGHDCGQYCQKVGDYTQYPEIFADVTLSKTLICACDPNDTIDVTASLKDAEGSVLPITQTWTIRLTHESETDIDRLLLAFVDGVCSSTYSFLQGLFLGEWHIDEEKFDLVEYGGTLYKVRLLNPVSFTVYRP